MGVVKTFLLPSYGFSFGYKRKGVSFAPLTEARRNIVGHKYALSKATVMRTRILSVTPPNPLGVPAPLTSKGSQENGVNAIPCRGYNPSVKPTACQLPFNKERSSVIYRGKGGKAACVWCKASNTECLCSKAAQTFCLRYTGEPRSALSSPCRAQGAKAAEPRWRGALRKKSHAAEQNFCSAACFML